ncbi:MAG: hypothetical protein BWY83_02707 [bacterium ADurb.Bin478]|nr:MAG: hypothetical protein BWY83_02707 [bacterium ADurb.Bin478]
MSQFDAVKIIADLEPVPHLCGQGGIKGQRSFLLAQKREDGWETAFLEFIPLEPKRCAPLPKRLKAAAGGFVRRLRRRNQHRRLRRLFVKHAADQVLAIRTKDVFDVFHFIVVRFHWQAKHARDVPESLWGAFTSRPPCERTVHRGCGPPVPSVLAIAGIVEIAQPVQPEQHVQPQQLFCQPFFQFFLSLFDQPHGKAQLLIVINRKCDQ